MENKPEEVMKKLVEVATLLQKMEVDGEMVTVPRSLLDDLTERAEKYSKEESWLNVADKWLIGDRISPEGSVVRELYETTQAYKDVAEELAVKIVKIFGLAEELEIENKTDFETHPDSWWEAMYQVRERLHFEQRRLSMERADPSVTGMTAKDIHTLGLMARNPHTLEKLASLLETDLAVDVGQALIQFFSGKTTFHTERARKLAMILVGNDE